MTNNDDQGPDASDRAPKEPSARARMVTERLRREDEQRAAEQRRRFGRSAPPRNDPPGWRTGPAWQERNGRAASRRRLKATGAVVFIAALALIAVRPELLIDRLTGKAEARQEAREAPPLPAESERPSAPPEAVDPDRPTLAEPFRGSPALQWADGAAGIEIPEATAVGGMSKEKVAKALEQAKAFLVASNLDAATLRGERPKAALDLLDPLDRETRKLLDTSLAQPSRENDPLFVFSRFDPAEAKPVGEVVKVRGRMWVEPGEGAGQAHVRADYSFVYPLVKAKDGADQVERTIVRRELTFSIADPRKWESTPGTLWLVQYGNDVANSACDVYDGFMHPGFDDDPLTGPTPSGPPMDPYDRSKGIEADQQEGCGTVSRT
ncbi:hypothetical protein [Streptomyces xanthophaeus]|uniref:Uncharacterized protein n=1 Tax=Streptomyces xanthophaeus TaxID=67385 RepID=A0A919GVQ9_9ACTN|nr:hypothetical protein [Streptomyces xanthophaeus]GHI85345.1 hypothetical protein Sxan_27090 [Streptomyces xanthophaeus]